MEEPSYVIFAKNEQTLEEYNELSSANMSIEIKSIKIKLCHYTYMTPQQEDTSQRWTTYGCSILQEEYHSKMISIRLTHYSGRVTQICIFNTVKLGTSASSP